jgi:hypothetical protein
MQIGEANEACSKQGLPSLLLSVGDHFLGNFLLPVNLGNNNGGGDDGSEIYSPTKSFTLSTHS